ncbi:MAG: hypothetical protein EBZ74_10875 [Planctomycetia bacterium]|nr:hypothetical protein [Planctomycetia bacterium]
MELKKEEEQTRHIIHDNKNKCAVVYGCAGSRKTELMIQKGLQHLKENKKNHCLFLTLVGSVSNEIIERIEKKINRSFFRFGTSNHFVLNTSGGQKIGVSNLDAYIDHCISSFPEYEREVHGKNYSWKSEFLLEKIKQGEFSKMTLKDGTPITMILIDECQDLDETKSCIFSTFYNQHKDSFSLFVVGDLLQDIFWKKNMSCSGMQKIRDDTKAIPFFRAMCFRCPSSHIDVVNVMTSPFQKKYGLPKMISYHSFFQEKNVETANRPIFFSHPSLYSHKHTFETSRIIISMVSTLLEHDQHLSLEDIVIIMPRSNHQLLFDYIVEQMGPDKVEKVKTKTWNHKHIPISWNKHGKMRLLSIHGDKGKGHKAVFFMGLEHEQFPHEACQHGPMEIIYQSLLNVALTRSTQYLFVGIPYEKPSCYFLNCAEELSKISCFSWNPIDFGFESSLEKKMYYRVFKYSSSCLKSPFIPVPSWNVQEEEDIHTTTKTANNTITTSMTIKKIPLFSKIYLNQCHTFLDKIDVNEFFSSLSLSCAVKSDYIFPFLSNPFQWKYPKNTGPFLSDWLELSFLMLYKNRYLQRFVTFFQDIFDHQGIMYIHNPIVMAILQDYQCNRVLFKHPDKWSSHWNDCLYACRPFLSPQEKHQLISLTQPTFFLFFPIDLSLLSCSWKHIPLDCPSVWFDKDLTYGWRHSLFIIWAHCKKKKIDLFLESRSRFPHHFPDCRPLFDTYHSFRQKLLLPSSSSFVATTTTTTQQKQKTITNDLEILSCHDTKKEENKDVSHHHLSWTYDTSLSYSFCIEDPNLLRCLGFTEKEIQEKKKYEISFFTRIPFWDSKHFTLLFFLFHDVPPLFYYIFVFFTYPFFQKKYGFHISSFHFINLSCQKIIIMFPSFVRIEKEKNMRSICKHVFEIPSPLLEMVVEDFSSTFFSV